MGYGSKKNKPFEWASKAQHSHIINDPIVKKMLGRCKFPSSKEEAYSDIRDLMFELDQNASSNIIQVIAVDGGYSDVIAQKGYPSSKVAFFQFGALSFKFSDLESLSNSPFIHPEQMEKFKKLDRFKLALPTKGVSFDSLDMLNSVRKSIIEFFNEKVTKTSFMDTLKWFVFHEYKFKSIDEDYSLKEIVLQSLPDNSIEIGKDGITVNKDEIKPDGSFKYNGVNFNLIDIFRFHEVVDDELGASGILGYLTNVVEHIIILHWIKEVYQSKPAKLKNFLFIKDGPLGFFGQTAKLHKDMRELCNHFIPEYGLKLVGLEKSGVFVEHAEEISASSESPLEPGNVLPLTNNYIYKHILPGPSSLEELNNLSPYASSSYYSGKLIYKSISGRTWVMTLPIRKSELIKNLNRECFQDLDGILNAVDKLRCDMYDNAIVPVALVNQLVSLANHPSAKILEKFASQSISD